MIKAVKFVSIPVRNQDRALEFYTAKLGMTVMTDQPMGPDPGAQRWIELAIPGAETRVVLFTPAGHEDRIGGFSTAVFASDNLSSSAYATEEILRVLMYAGLGSIAFAYVVPLTVALLARFDPGAP